MNKLQVEYVDAEAIKEHPAVPNIRSEIRYEEIRELIDSIRTDGIRVPINCFRENGNIYLVNGWRRKTAIDAILKEDPVHPVKTVPVIFVEYNQESAIRDALCDNLVDNIHRQDVNPYDMARRLATLIDMGLDNQAICQKLNKSISWIRDTMSLLTADRAVQESLKREEINVTEARQISKLPQEKQAAVVEGLVEARKENDTVVVKELKKKAKEATNRTQEAKGKKEITKKWKMLEVVVAKMKEVGDDVKNKDNFLIFSGALIAFSWVLGHKKEFNVEKHYEEYTGKQPEKTHVDVILRKNV